MITYVRLALLIFAICGSALPAAMAQKVAPLPPQAEPCPPAKPQQPPPPRGTQSGCGVIEPPAVGDRGVLKPPATGAEMPMPVIPPPGTPGGNPTVQPK